MDYTQLSKEELINTIYKIENEVELLKESTNISKKAIHSDEIYRILFESSNDAIFLMSKEMFIECNSKAVEMFACPNKSMLVNNPPFKFSPKVQPDGRESKEKAFEIINAALSGKPQHFEWLHSKYDGTPFMTEIHLNKIGYKNLPHLIVLIKDISDKEAAVRAEKESKELFYIIINNMDEGAILLDFNGKIIFVNPAGLMLLGKTRKEDVVEQNINSFINIKTQKKIGGILKKIDKGKSGILGELSFKDHEWVESLATRIKYQGQWICLLTIRNLSEKRESHLALRQSEERYRTLFELSPSGIILEDSEGKIIDINPVSCKSFGYSREQLLGKFIHEFTIENNKKVNENIKQILKGKRLTHVVKNIFKDGSVIYLELIENKIPLPDGQFGILSVSNNITDRIKTLNALKESEENYRLLAETINDTIIALDFEYRITYINKAAEKNLGIFERDFIGENIFKYIPEKYHNKIKERKKIRKSGNREHLILELEIMNKSGQLVPVETISSPIIKNDKLIGILIVARDISLRKKLESHLIQTQKMEAIGRLAGGIAHDFNNLLTIIMGHNKLIYGQIDSDSPIKPNLNQIEKAGKRARKSIQHLLNFSRKQILQPEYLNINVFIKNLQRIISQLLNTNIKLNLYLEADSGMIKVDPLHLEQSILNLLINARETVSESGLLEVRTKNVSIIQPLKSRYGIIQPGSYILLEISDNGPEIPEKLLQNIFEPFVNTEGEYLNRGLELASVYGFVKQSNGYIDVVSTHNNGSVFSIYLPVYQDKTKKIPAKQKRLKKQSNKTIILVVEDEFDLKNLICEILKQNKYEVICAANGEEALQKIQEYRDDLDVILSDIIMPKMGGPEFIEKLLETDYKLPGILFMSGYSDKAIANDKWEGEKIEFIQKPFTPIELINKIKALL